ncbi:hypothetical protein [Streptomyces europaeiscabiei]|uniref:hypothetical protein n=1 Tax=Streptomyces europaeiscabiei TaxID=146819 RepID=UPI0029A5B37C|nr:hypothetical protein [Streptomyces europaeiscabiei]MDX3780588.1 hypothetical protein [Streptomyces europaeiscabiei]
MSDRAVRSSTGWRAFTYAENDGYERFVRPDRAGRVEVERTGVDRAEVDRAEVDSAEVDRAEVDRAEVDSAEVDRAEVDRVRVTGAAAFEALVQTGVVMAPR